MNLNLVQIEVHYSSSFHAFCSPQVGKSDCVVQFSLLHIVSLKNRSDCNPNSPGLVGMGAAAARALIVQRIQQFGPPLRTHSAVYTRQQQQQQLSPGLAEAVPALTNTHRRFVTVRRANAATADSWKSFNIRRAMDESSVNTNVLVVTRVGMKQASYGTPRASFHLGNHRVGKGLLASKESAASTSESSAHEAEKSRPKDKEKQSSQGLGVFAIGAGIFSTILSYIIKLCGGGYTPYVKQAEKDINKVADFVDEGARLVVKVADEIEEIAHAADLSAQEAEDLALKVEAKTKMVKETLDAIADVLEGDQKLSTVLTDYANTKKETNRN